LAAQRLTTRNERTVFETKTILKMLAVSIILLLAICVVVRTANLRADIAGRMTKEEDALPKHPDPNVGARLLEQIRSLTSNGAKMNGVTHGKSFAPVSARSGDDGFWMSRSVSNADCTGDNTNELGTRMGYCHADGKGGSHYTTCDSTKDGKIAQYHHSFATADCGGEKRTVSTSMEYDTCRFVPQFVPYYGFTKQQTSCSKGLSSFTEAKPGVMLSYFADSACKKDSVQYFSRVPIGTCRMFVSGGDEVGELDSTSNFGYVKLVGCVGSGQVNLRFYSDAQCTQATHVGTMSLAQDPLYNACQFDASVGGDGMWGTATCQA
jgi:hypothetical protein